MNVHKMRRAAQALTEDECVDVLRRGTAGVLALAGGPDEWPYAVPMSYAYRDGVVTFHGAMEGHKHELIAANSNASFCVIDADEVVPADYTTRYRSVICFGAIEVVDDPAEQEKDLMFMGEAFNVGHPEECREEISHWAGKTRVLRLRVERMTGKESGALMRERRAADPSRGEGVA